MSEFKEVAWEDESSEDDDENLLSFRKEELDSESEEDIEAIASIYKTEYFDASSDEESEESLSQTTLPFYSSDDLMTSESSEESYEYEKDIPESLEKDIPESLEKDIPEEEPLLKTRAPRTIGGKTSEEIKAEILIKRKKEEKSKILGQEKRNKIMENYIKLSNCEKNKIPCFPKNEDETEEMYQMRKEIYLNSEDLSFSGAMTATKEMNRIVYGSSYEKR